MSKESRKDAKDRGAPGVTAAATSGAGKARQRAKAFAVELAHSRKEADYGLGAEEGVGVTTASGATDS
jgi:hypothetical protein